MKIEKKYVIIFLFFAFFLRLYVAGNISQTNADEILYMLLANGTLSSSWHRLATLYHGPIYFYLTDLSYSLLGTSILAARFFPALFSSISVLLVYLIAKQLYDSRTGVIASIIFAFSAAQLLLGTLALLDILATTISMLSFLFLLKWHRTGTRMDLVLSAALYAVAITTKISQLFLLPLFAIPLIHRIWTNRAEMENKKTHLLSLAIFLILLAPVPTYNFLLYSSTGLADFHYSRAFNLETSLNYLRWLNIAGVDDQYFDMSRIGANTQYILSSAQSYFSLLLPAFFIIGLAKLMARRTLSDAMLFAWFFIPLLTFLSYVFHEYYLVVLLPPMCIAAAIGLQSLSGHLQKFLNSGHIVPLLLFVLVLSELSVLPSHVTGPPATYKLYDYIRQLPDNATIVMDATIWTGNSYLVREFSGKNVVFLSDFLHAQNVSQENPGTARVMDVYHVICVPGNCGWSSIEEGTKQLSEAADKKIRENAQKVTDIYEQGHVEYSIYRITLTAYPVSNPYQRFVGYELGHPEISVDAYDIYTVPRSALHNLSVLILSADLLLALSVPFVVFFLFLREQISVDL
jgi:hypothetical protein